MMINEINIGPFVFFTFCPPEACRGVQIQIATGVEVESGWLYDLLSKVCNQPIMNRSLHAFVIDDCVLKVGT